MINVIIIDEDKEGREVLETALKNIEEVQEITCFEELPEDKELYSKIDLVIFDINSNNFYNMLQKMQEIKAEFANINFIASSFEINPKIVNEALSQGAVDFLLKPVISSVLQASIKKICLMGQQRKSNAICIFSNKGGIGKTSIATNLAWEIYNKTENKICILDFSFNSHDASLFLSTDKKVSAEQILPNIEELDENVLLSQLGRYKDSQIYVLEAQSDILPEPKITPKNIAKMINALKNIFDYVIIDTSSIINEANAAIFDNTDLILLICTTNLSSINSCKKCYELFDKIGYDDDKIKLIINRYIESEEVNMENIENAIGKKVFQTIPNNYLTIIDAINLSQNVGETNPQSNIAKAYSKIADEILEIDFETLKSKAKPGHGIFDLLQKIGEE